MNKTMEIGSEFWNIPLSDQKNSLFPSDTSWYMSGRSALKSIIADILKKKSVKKAALPAWCCDSMIIPFVESGIEVSFYPVYVNGGSLTQDISAADGCDILLILDYFGYTANLSICGFRGTVIRDVTHSLFSAQYADADYYFGSLRKWAGFFTGGYAWGLPMRTLPVDNTYVSMRRLAMEAKSEYISGLSDSKEYLEMFSKAEEYLEQAPLGGAMSNDITAAKYINADLIKMKRRKNAAVLLSSLADMAIFPTADYDVCPMFVPILVPMCKRNKLRQHLIRHQIYCPVHWPITKYHYPDNKTVKIYDNELSLVCDQRYDENDMERLAETIKEYLRG